MSMDNEVYLVAVHDVPADASLLHELRSHLAPLLARRRATLFDNTLIQPGDRREEVQRLHREGAAVLVLLLSAEFLDRCHQEAHAALAQRDRGARVLPLLVRPCTWNDDPALADLQPLPHSGRALSQEPDRDAALSAVACEIVALVQTAGSIAGPYLPQSPLEAEARRRLTQPRMPLVVQGPWRFGKGTLISRLTAQVPGRVVRLDLDALLEEEPESFASLDGLLRLLARRLLSQLSLPGAGDGEALMQTVWQRPGAPKGKLAWLLEHHVLPACDPIHLSLERAERVDGRYYQNDFFAMLRSWVENQRSPWERLRLLVSVATEPMHLESTDHSSFFVRANPLRMPPLSRDQIGELAARRGFSARHAALDRLAARTAGHPDLVYHFLREAVLRGGPLRDEDPADWVFLMHLQRLRAFVERNGLMEQLGQVLQGKRIPWDDYCRLYQPGLVVEDDPGSFRLRCPLYTDYFGKLCRH